MPARHTNDKTLDRFMIGEATNGEPRVVELLPVAGTERGRLNVAISAAPSMPYDYHYYSGDNVVAQTGVGTTQFGPFVDGITTTAFSSYEVRIVANKNNAGYVEYSYQDPATAWVTAGRLYAGESVIDSYMKPSVWLRSENGTELARVWAEGE